MHTWLRMYTHTHTHIGSHAIYTFILLFLTLINIPIFFYLGCAQMRDNYQRLKRAFMAIDKHLDGFVSIEDLRAILSNFTLPMSDQLFSQLMTRWVWGL